MKKMMMFALIASCTSTAFADLPQIIFEGKSIDPTDNRTSLIKKLGKPSAGDQSYSYWGYKPNYSISASYGTRGLKEFGIAQLKSKPVNVQLNLKGQSITLGKDTINSAVKKLKYGCFDILDTQFNQNYSFSVAANGLNVVMDAPYTGNKSSSANKPILGIKFNSNTPDQSEGCNY